MELKCDKCGREFKKERSNPQNRYYWGVIVEILSEHTGFTKDEMHEVLKHKFLRKSLWVVKKGGLMELSVISYSTTELTTSEMEDYLSQIRIWASEDLGLVLPLPNEV